MIFLLTGESGSGKTTLLIELAGILKNCGLATGGFTAPGTWLNGQRSGFILHDLCHNLDYPLAETGSSGVESHGRFVFNEETLATGTLLLKTQAREAKIDFVLIDEVGPFELKGRGWASSLDILACSGLPQLWVVRPELLKEVPLRWKFNPEAVFYAKTDSAGSVYRELAARCSFPQR